MLVGYHLSDGRLLFFSIIVEFLLIWCTENLLLAHAKYSYCKLARLLHGRFTGFVLQTNIPACCRKYLLIKSVFNGQRSSPSVIDFCGGKYPPRFVLWHHDPSTEIGRGMELSCIVTIINKAAMMSSKYYSNKTVNKMAIHLFFSCKRCIISSSPNLSISRMTLFFLEQGWHYWDGRGLRASAPHPLAKPPMV